MSSLFLDSLGLICLSLVALLFWDAHLAKRRLRQWADTSAGNGFKSNRFKFAKPGLLFSMGATVFLVAAVNRHAAQTHPASIARTDAQIQNAKTGSPIFDVGNLTGIQKANRAWNTIFAAATSPDASILSPGENIKNIAGRPKICECLLGIQSVPHSESNLQAAISLNDCPAPMSAADEFDYDSIATMSQGSKVNDDSVQVPGEIAMQNQKQSINYALNGALFLNSTPISKFNAALLTQ